MSTPSSAEMADVQIEVARSLGLIIPNEFLFITFCLASDWNKPITSIKLAKELGCSETLVRDHLNMLVTLNLFRKQGQRYTQTDLGRYLMLFLRQSVVTEQITDLMTMVSASENISRNYFGINLATNEQNLHTMTTEYSAMDCRALPKREPEAESNLNIWDSTVTENAT
jgi:hypothetical protein